MAQLLCVNGINVPSFSTSDVVLRTFRQSRDNFLGPYDELVHLEKFIKTFQLFIVEGKPGDVYEHKTKDWGTVHYVILGRKFGNDLPPG